MIKLLASSVNPEKLSLTIKGLIPLIIIIVSVFGFNVTEIDVNVIVDNIVKIVVAIGGIASLFATLYGLIRKIAVSFKKK